MVRKGITHHIANEADTKGIFVIRFKNKHYKVMFLHDYLAIANSSKYKFFKSEQSERKNLITQIQNRKRFGYLVCVSGNSIPSVISDENGIFEVMVGRHWRKCQFIDQYRQQHRLGSKSLVQHKLYNAADGLEEAVIHRAATEQNIILVVLPKK